VNANSLVMSGLSTIVQPLARLAASKDLSNATIYGAARAVFGDMLACGLMLRAEGGGVKPVIIISVVVVVCVMLTTVN
jgi:hypothetical protein